MGQPSKRDHYGLPPFASFAQSIGTNRKPAGLLKPPGNKSTFDGWNLEARVRCG
jgi:hypothetical protein